MKKIIFSFQFILFCITLFAQEEVTFNFSRALTDEVKLKIKLFVNGVEAAQLKDGGSSVYKVALDVSKPVTVQARYGAIKQELTFKISQGNVCNLETNFVFSEKKINVYLQLLSGGVPEPGTGLIAGFKPNRSNLSLAYTSVRDLPSDTIRLRWLERGGRIIGNSYVGSLTLIRLNTTDLKMTGTGGQFTVTSTSLNFKVPEYKPGIRTWNSGVFGTSFGAQFFGNKITVSGLASPITSFSANYVISVNAGYTLGVGKFKSETNWKGVAFELSYKPSLIINLPVEEDAKTSLSLNMGGFGLDFNFNNFTSNAVRLAPKAQSKFTVFIFPPVKNGPLIINFGYGLTYYKKPFKW